MADALNANTTYTVTVAENEAYQPYVFCNTSEHTFTFTTDENAQLAAGSTGTSITNYYTYYYIPYYPPYVPPTIEIEDDDALGLNTTDHFAYIIGYPDGTFGPQRSITRAETMTLVNRVLDRQPETEDDLLPNMTVWTDNANPKAWYYLAVQEATNSHHYKFKTNSKYEKWSELRETRDWTQLEK